MNSLNLSRLSEPGVARSELSKSTWAISVVAVFIAICCSAATFAQDSSAKKIDRKKVPTRVSKTFSPAEGYSPVEMFLAMENGTIKVELIPKDATQASIFVTNISDEPLAIEMPEAFVGVPILAQGFGNGLGNGQGQGQGRGGGNQGGGGGQGFGGGSGQGQGGGNFGGNRGGNNNRGGGVFNIPPGKRARIKITTICLEFHKVDPRPSMKYEIKPAADFIKDQSVLEMIKMVANDEVTQPIAQAAAWHRLDGLSWQFLQEHNRKRLSNGYFERFFTSGQISWAKRLIPFAEQRVAAYQEESEMESSDWNTSR